MMQRRQATQFLDLARLMVKQARILRDEGLTARARELVTRAIAFDRLGWTMLQPIPIRVLPNRNPRR
jgi:hypothetical protein